jgi:hypothetical protein
VGNQIVVRYYEQAALSLRKDEGPPINKDETVVREQEGGMGMNAPSAAQQEWVGVAPLVLSPRLADWTPWRSRPR